MAHDISGIFDRDQVVHQGNRPNTNVQQMYKNKIDETNEQNSELGKTPHKHVDTKGSLILGSLSEKVAASTSRLV